MAQFRREWSVIIDSVEITGLRTQFRVVKGAGAGQDPNTLDLRVSNLSEATRGKLQRGGVPVVLIAGYQGASQVIFSGDCRTIDHVRQGADWVTHVQCGDGETAYLNGYSVLSYGPGVSVVEIVHALAKDLRTGDRVNVGDALAALDRGRFTLRFQSYLQGYSVAGPTVRVLGDVLQAHRIAWSIQDGTLLFRQGDTGTPAPAVVLSADTGLVGSPEHGGRHHRGKMGTVLTVQSLLNGAIRPGRRIDLESGLRGLYVAGQVEHVGDSHGGEWVSRTELVPAPSGETTAP